MLRALCPKLRIMARDNVVRVVGDEEEMAAFEDLMRTIEKHCAKFNSPTEEDILLAVKGRPTTKEVAEGVIVYSTGGKPITPRTENQRRLVEAYAQSDMIFAVGPAGSGKTYTAIALAVRALKNKEVKKIILSRPAVEAGEKTRLPARRYEGQNRPLPATPLRCPAGNDTRSQVAGIHGYKCHSDSPLAFMRGRTLNDAVVILDEAQNTTTAQIKMFLTRMGWNTKMIITGDRTQIDLPPSQKSGLTEAQRILEGIKGISFIEMNEKRHYTPQTRHTHCGRLRSRGRIAQTRAGKMCKCHARRPNPWISKGGALSACGRLHIFCTPIFAIINTEHIPTF